MQPAAFVDIVYRNIDHPSCQARRDPGYPVVLRDDLDRLDGEGLLAVLGEHGNHDIADDIQLGLVRRRDLDENVGGIERDLGVIAVDNGRKRADDLVGIEDDGIDRLVPDDVEVATKVLIRFVERHQLFPIHLLGLVEWDEVDIFGRKCLIREGPLDRVEIVGADPSKLVSVHLLIMV